MFRSNWWEAGGGHACSMTHVVHSALLWVQVVDFILSVPVMTQFGSFPSLVFQIMGISILCSSLIIQGPFLLCPVRDVQAGSGLYAGIFCNLYWCLEKRILRIEHCWPRMMVPNVAPWVLGALVASSWSDSGAISCDTRSCWHHIIVYPLSFTDACHTGVWLRSLPAPEGAILDLLDSCSCSYLTAVLSSQGQRPEHVCQYSDFLSLDSNLNF